MTMSYAQQNGFGGTVCGAASAVRAFAFALILLGTALAVSIFVSLGSLILPILVLAVQILIVHILGILAPRYIAGPENRQGE